MNPAGFCCCCVPLAFLLAVLGYWLATDKDRFTVEARRGRPAGSRDVLP